MGSKKRKLSGLLATFMIFHAGFSLSVNADTSHVVQKEIQVVGTYNEDGNAIIENESYQMLLDEKTLGIVLEDKKSGHSYESTKLDEKSNASWKGFLNSGVSVEFYSKRSTMPERVDVLKEDVGKEYTYFENGFNAFLDFKNYEFTMIVEVRLNSTGFTVKVDEDSIVEGEEYKLGSIYLYPMFGATQLDEKEGYMLVPEGAGALIDFSNNHGKYKTPYSKKIYGMNAGIDKFTTSEEYRPSIRESEKVLYPIFGIVYTEEEQGFLGIVEDGKYNAEILAYPNGVITDYNWITAKFNFREVYTMQTASKSGVPSYENQGDMRDISIRYEFVTGENADYVGLAKTYQEYLLQNQLMYKQEDSFQVKLDFFGADTKKWLIFDRVVPMTTIDDIQYIIDDIRVEGVDNVLPLYRGWQKSGVSINRGSSNVKIEGKLGSQRELEELNDKLVGYGINLVLEQDLLYANPKRFYNTSADIVKGVNQMLVEEPTNGWVYKTMYYLTPSKALEISKKYRKQYNNSSIKEVALTSIPNVLFSNYKDKQVVTRQENAIVYEDIMKELQDMAISLEQPADYLWKYTSKYFDMPLATSGYSFLSKEIPFLPIVLKGYIPYWAQYSNFEANEATFFLKMIEYGAYPNFLVTMESPDLLRNTNSSYIYTSEYSVLKPTILQYEKEIGDILSFVEGENIIGHEYLTNDIVVVEYSNGIEIVINYSDRDYMFNESKVDARWFKIFGE